jgi:hypothetical protein
LGSGAMSTDPTPSDHFTTDTDQRYASVLLAEGPQGETVEYAVRRWTGAYPHVDSHAIDKFGGEPANECKMAVKEAAKGWPKEKVVSRQFDVSTAVPRWPV